MYYDMLCPSCKILYYDIFCRNGKIRYCKKDDEDRNAYRLYVETIDSKIYLLAPGKKMLWVSYGNYDIGE
jgi:hypothetical protein